MASSSEIYIEATETDPAVRAQVAIRAVHQRLRMGLAAFGEAEPVAGSQSVVHAALVDFCTGELRHHLAAADQTLFAAASGAAETRLLARALRTTTAALDAHIDALAATDHTATGMAIAQVIEAVLDVHLATEETVLLPALAALPGANLPALVTDMLTLLAGGELDHPPVLDVREIPHGQRHPRIFARYGRLDPGESFVLVNNHDPKPLRREFEATHPGTHTWDYIESGPEIWRVRIGMAAVGA
ncbi:DUF2249 domain-containing protein [Streptomyces sp. NBC_00201]|uniref:DUF2249 domain-containing protein n=1 Tax=unclassified Streptomyces TaxID=2593676 RepID=UPI0022544F96|nr:MULTISPECIES: DUF2249 domain-containing protein [unclassified Streptomyces]MCX5251298.1 DUF2249 domain-containing protein [Streptomyces sp. NBC_00201]MCX5294779.1 DUF2249 domain-containing protein [Streptomyces sp. NBC_00183]